MNNTSEIIVTAVLCITSYFLGMWVGVNQVDSLEIEQIRQSNFNTNRYFIKYKEKVNKCAE